MKRSLLAVLVAVSLLIGMTGIAWAAVTTVNLSSGDSVVAKCAGTKLAWSRQNTTQMTLRCQGASSTPSSTPTTPTPTSTGGGGLCSPVVYSSSEATATINFNDTWWVDNDAWSGSHGPQTINVCSATSWYAVSNQKDVQGQVETYPNTEYDVGGRSTPSKKTIAQYASITSTYDESFPTDSSMDAAYDLWMNNWNQEVMIWNEVHGSNTYWLTCTGCGNSDVTVAGVNYRFINFGDEFVFIQKNMSKSGSVNLLAVLKYLVGQGLLKGTDVPTQLEYGVEISATNGTETFPLNDVTFSLT